MTSDAFRNLKIEHLQIDSIKMWERNARTHSKKQIQQIAESIKTFGVNNPISIDANQQIIAGHGNRTFINTAR